MPELSRRAWVAAFKRTIAEFKDDDLLDWAAALTFFALLSLFPALVVMVALLGIFGQYPQTIDSMAEILTGAGVAQDTVDSIRAPVDDVVRNTGGAGALLGIGLVGRSGRRRATSAPSGARRTPSTRSRRVAPTGSCARCRSR